MADGERRYLLGRGERLTEDVFVPRAIGPKHHPYQGRQLDRLLPRIERLTTWVNTLPDLACPEDRTVALLTLHPTYLAKSYFPTELLRETRLRSVGSRPTFIKPERGEAGPATELFIAGKRSDFRKLATIIRSELDEKAVLAVEDIRPIDPQERLRLPELPSEIVLEVVLHAPNDWESVLSGFDEYAMAQSCRVDIERRRLTSNLSFMPVRARREHINDLAVFSFLRVARVMPTLRELEAPMEEGSRGISKTFSISFPQSEVVDQTIRVAVFDGGLPNDSPLRTWVTVTDAGDVGSPVDSFQMHGEGVTSASLFGPLQTGQAHKPFPRVDHYRVLDQNSFQSNGEYIDVLDRVVDILTTNHYDFVSLSLGPRLAIDDDEVHPWTAKLDELLSSGKTLMFSAVGNDGHLDRPSGLARIQPPSDGVNVLSVGATVSRDDSWCRASYSCVGPGRTPGLVKPDVVAFGGSTKEPFWVVAGNAARPTHGTSFAAPALMRISTGIRAHFGGVIHPLGIRALLVHNADPASHAQDEVGWGLIGDDIDRLVRCDPGVVHVLYEGVLKPRQVRRVRIPFPDMSVPGKVTIAATFCIASEVDPEDPFNYTRAGLVPRFRPHSERFTPWIDSKTGEHRTSMHPDTKPFFTLREYMTERELREDAHQWETVLHHSQRFRGSSLKDPVFDIHYNPREAGANAANPAEIPYAFVISIHAERLLDIYDRVVARYRTLLEPLRPVIAIPIGVR